MSSPLQTSNGHLIGRRNGVLIIHVEVEGGEELGVVMQVAGKKAGKPAWPSEIKISRGTSEMFCMSIIPHMEYPGKGEEHGEVVRAQAVERRGSPVSAMFMFQWGSAESWEGGSNEDVHVAEEARAS